MRRAFLFIASLFMAFALTIGHANAHTVCGSGSVGYTVETTIEGPLGDAEDPVMDVLNTADGVAGLGGVIC